MAKHQYIIAIGASAGGLEALTAFFEHTPMDSVSYVIIPHLSPDFKSRMVEILSRHSSLEVLEAEEGMRVETNKVYLIPNRKYMGIKDGQLFMYEKEGQPLPHMTIDVFFTSLAEERGNRAIGVVLSGGGSDGSRGAVAIENAGGMVMVQDPSNAKFDGMPNATIAISNTSYILPAEELPMAIQQYVHEDQNIGIEPDAPLSEEFLSNIVNLIKGQFPFDFTEYKLPTLERRIKRRMLHQNIKDENLFFSYLQENPSEVELLIGDFLIGVTSFFRDAEAFHILENEVIPQIVEQKSGNDYIKIWVACCATGEEAYSLAILIKEYLVKNKMEIDVKIFATDINRTALNQAAKGVFSDKIVKTVSQQRLDDFFDKGVNNYKIKPDIRRMLIFAQHDLIKNPPYCDVDLISCRNMLIYVKPALQKQILSKLSFGLRKNGYLFLGSSENISIAKDDFTEVSAKWKIYQSVVIKRRINIDNSLSAPLSDLPLEFIKNVTKDKISTMQPALLPSMTEMILTESGFCGVSIDQEGNVIQAFGDLSPYLKSERFNFNLQQLLPETLALAFSASLNKVVKLNQRVRINNIEFTEPDSARSSRVDLLISPFGDRKSKIKGLMVLFKPVVETPEGQRAGKDFSIDIQTKEYIAQLEEDIYQLRQDLLSSSELLESSKEAMQAYNEELLSANEEMQSTNEELQSINEELETINTEHKYTIEELTNLNDDLNNYFRSNINGQLFVDRDILLKKYSPGAIKHINIRESDIGRPLSNITTNIKFETLIEDIKKVMSNGEIIIQEIESNEGKIYQVMTSPYLRKSNKEIYGAIITFYDISELKKMQDELKETSKMLGLATVAGEIGTWSINVHTRELISSHRLKEIFSFPTEEQMTFDLMIAQIVSEQQSLVRNSIEKSITSGEKFEIEYPIHGFQDGKLRWVRAMGNLTHNKEGKTEYLTGIMHDVTDHKLDDMRKNDFISIVSHELKTPLTSLTGYLQILAAKAQKVNDTFGINALAKANYQVKKMTTLINDFLNVSRLENGKIYLNRQTFEIDELVKEIVEEVMTSTSGYHITLLPGCKLTVNADRDKIGQVISNLLSNAIKYSQKTCNIEVSCVELPNVVQVSIKDDGIGINIEDQEKLFDRYSRIESMNTKTISGFGIGLYLSSEIIQRHNGKIWVESKIDEGSTFCFSLPLV
ncbi:CheR family methyltransferase [Pedobacter immunditicola]|uniref:CheR family methyltransferase n=1 Tax=Pedobacter immunditicola TaxID=3133440 RepID=UPI0030AD5D2D